MPSERLYNRRFIHLLCIEATLQFGLYTMNPIVSSYAVFLGASVAVGAFVASLNSVASIFSRSVTGMVTDRLSKKWLLVFASAIFCIAAFGCSLSTSVVWVGIFRALQGVAFALKSALTVSLASLIVPPSKVGAGVGSLGMAFTVACALGPAAGSWLSRYMGYDMCFVLSGILFVVGFVLATTFKAPASAGSHRLERISGKGGFRKSSFSTVLNKIFYLPSLPYTLVVGCVVMAQGTNMNLIVLVGSLKGVDGSWVYFLMYAAVTFFTKPLAGRMSDKYGAAAVIVPMSVVTSVGMLLLAFNFSLETIIVAAICMGFGHGSMFSTLQSSCVRGAPADKTGRAANMFYLGNDFGFMAGSTISGIMLQFFGVQAAYLFTCAMIATGLCVFLFFAKGLKLR